MLKHRLRNIVAVAILGMGGVAVAAAGDHYLPTYGGSGGNYFLDSVSHGFMVGFHGRTGQYNDSVAWIEQDGAEGGLHGGAGGIEYRISCPSGWITHGIYGHSGGYIDQLGTICIQQSTQSEQYTVAKGGAGGIYFEERCSTGEGAVGLQGRAAGYVDQLGLVCNVNGR